MSGFFHRLWRGRAEDPAWVRPALLALLVGTGLLYLVGLGKSGWANAFYSAAVQAGAHSWKAFFFGSSDAANFITVDKPPMSLWIMELSARVFGVNTWSILVPQALEGVATVGVLYLIVRRWFSPAAALIAGAVCALTPVAALMFRFNNPDALLVLLTTLAAYAVVRALERANPRWLVLAGVLIGCGFLTKMLQAFLIVPVFALVYLIAAPTPVRRRLWHLVLAGAALVVSSGWWIAIVSLWPASSRPYIGGSQHNSVLELVFGYNGLGRLSGNETGSIVPGGAGQAGAWGPTGWDRLFTSTWGGQIAWLLPAALACIVVIVWLAGRAPRTDRLRTAGLLWGGTLLVTAATFSFAQGIIHEYYAVALAPSIGALVGIGGAELWVRRGRLVCRLVLAAIVAGTAVWSFALLERSADWQPWLRFVVLVGALAIAGALVAVNRLTARIAVGLAAGAVVFGLAAPTAYSLQTASVAHSGSLPSAGPTVAGSRFGGHGGPGGFGRGFGQGGGQNMTPPWANGSRSANGSQSSNNWQGNNGTPPTPPQAGTANGTLQAPPSANGGATMAGPQGGSQGGSQGGGAAGGLLDASKPSAALVALLKADSDKYTWVAATVGAQSAAGYQLATDLPVMSLGGFNGSDPYPTLAEFKALVQAGKVHYFIASGMGAIGGGGLGGQTTGGQGSSRSQGFNGGQGFGSQTGGQTFGGGQTGGGPQGGFGGNAGGSSMSAITSWVSSNYTAKTVGGVTVYDLSSPTTQTVGT